MGCGGSKAFEAEWGAHGKAYTALHLSRSDIQKLWKVFGEIDTGKLVYVLALLFASA